MIQYDYPWRGKSAYWYDTLPKGPDPLWWPKREAARHFSRMTVEHLENARAMLMAVYLREPPAPVRHRRARAWAKRIDVELLRRWEPKKMMPGDEPH